MNATWQVTDAMSAPIAAVVAIAALVALVAIVLLARRRRVAGDETSQATLAVPGVPTVSPMRRGLARTRSGMLQRLLPLLGRSRLDAADVEALEEVLIGADVGVRTTQRLVQSLEQGARSVQEPLAERLEREVLAILEGPQRENTAPRASSTPWVIMVVGVNGVGKTTSIGKLAARYREQGKRTLLVAGDTFRAAAIEQLSVWAERTGADLVRHQHGSDPGAVAYDGVRAAVARGADIVIVDTAGRLHTKSNLMDELRKVRRVLAREVPGAPHETLLVVDAVTGQNGLAQARAFLQDIEVSGVVLTKLDGTAKGGIVLAIAGELGLPIRYVGVGESVEDLRDFDPKEFAAALLEPAEPSDLP